MRVVLESRPDVDRLVFLAETDRRREATKEKKRECTRPTRHVYVCVVRGETNATHEKKTRHNTLTSCTGRTKHTHRRQATGTHAFCSGGILRLKAAAAARGRRFGQRLKIGREIEHPYGWVVCNLGGNSLFRTNVGTVVCWRKRPSGRVRRHLGRAELRRD